MMACMTLSIVCCLQINWAMHDKQELIDIVEVVYRGARKGHGLVVSPKGAQQNLRHSPPSVMCCAPASGCILRLLGAAACPQGYLQASIIVLPPHLRQLCAPHQCRV